MWLLIVLCTQRKTLVQGRPTKDRQSDYFDYYIEAVVASDSQQRTHRLQRKSCFILASNQLNPTFRT